MRLVSVSVYKRTDDGFRKTVFDKAFVRRKESIGFEKGGRYKNTKMTVRIFSPSALDIKPNDMIELGIGDGAPGENALTVTEVCDNLDFSVAHVRISAM